MSLIDSAISAALDSYTSTNTVISEDKLSWKRKFQGQMNRITDLFVEELKTSDQQASAQMKLSQCIVATKDEIDALRVNLAQRYNILSGAFTRNRIVKREIEKPSGTYGQPSVKETLTETIGHECAQSKIDISRIMGWKNPKVQSECWQLTLNYFNHEGGPVFLSDSSYISIPRGTIMNEVDTYIEKVGNIDDFVKRYSLLFAKWVQQQIEQVADEIVQGYNNSQRPALGNKVVIQQCIIATEREIVMLCRYLIQCCGLQVMQRMREEHVHDQGNEPYHLSERVGYLHRGSSSHCYQLEVYGSSDDDTASSSSAFQSHDDSNKKRCIDNGPGTFQLGYQ